MSPTLAQMANANELHPESTILALLSDDERARLATPGRFFAHRDGGTIGLHKAQDGTDRYRVRWITAPR